MLNTLRRPRPRVAIVSLALSLACVLPATAEARLQVGVADQNVSTLQNPLYRHLGTTVTRLIVPWNVAFDRGRLPWVSAWLGQARADGVQPMIAFARFFGQSMRPPSVAAYTRAVRAFRRDFPWVRVYEAWNEGNHHWQPTYRRPWLAARYYMALRRNCRGCTVVAADILDNRFAIGWLRSFMRSVHGPRPRLWGLHSYIEANRKRRISGSLDAQLVRMLPGTVWLTEVGGIVRSGSFAYNEGRAAAAVRYVFRFARAFHIPRIYLYNWVGVVTKRQAHRRGHIWDSGLVGPNGRPRLGYFALRSELRQSHLGCWERGLSAALRAGCR